MYRQSYFSGIMNRKWEKTGIKDVSDNSSTIEELLLQDNMMYFCGFFEVPFCSRYATETVIKWMQNPTVIPSYPIYEGHEDWSEYLFGLVCAAVRSDGDSENENRNVFQFILTWILNATDEEFSKDQVGQQMINGLACTKNDTMLIELLNVYGRPNNINRAWSFVLRKLAPAHFLHVKPVTMGVHVINHWTRLFEEGNISESSYINRIKSIHPAYHMFQGLHKHVSKSKLFANF